MPKTRKKVWKVFFFNDPVGCIVGDTPKQEVAYCKRWLRDFIFKDVLFEFKTSSNSMDIIEKKYDILIFDFGGIGLGCTDMSRSLSREVLKLIEEKPSVLFIAWTSFTTNYLRDECENELGTYHNLLVRETRIENLVKGIKIWVKL